MCQYAKFVERTPVIVTGFMADEIDDVSAELWNPDEFSQ